MHHKINTVSLRLFGPYYHNNNEDSPLDEIYWRESYLLERFDALYMYSEDVLTMIHYMRPSSLHHHNQLGLLNVPIHRNAGTLSLRLVLRAIETPC
jgi:hypothetical protein